MKVVLVLCLLAFISCQKDIMDIAKCIYESPKVKELIADVIEAIATQDISKLFPKIKESLPELVQVVMKCIAENEANLQGFPIHKCTRHDLYMCGLKCREFSKTPEEIETCKNKCHAKCGY